MTDFFDNILTQMSSAFNNKIEPNPSDNLKLSGDKTLKWRGLHNNQFASARKRGKDKIKLNNKTNGDEGEEKDMIVGGAVVDDGNNPKNNSSSYVEQTNDQTNLSQDQQTDNVDDDIKTVRSNDNTTQVETNNENDKVNIKIENILKYRTRNQQSTITVVPKRVYRRKTIPNSENPTPSENSQTNTTDTNGMSNGSNIKEESERLSITGKTDEIVTVINNKVNKNINKRKIMENEENNVNKIRLRDRKSFLQKHFAEVLSDEIDKTLIAEPISSVVTASTEIEQNFEKPKQKRGRKKKVHTEERKDSVEDKPMSVVETKSESNVKDKSYAKLPKKRGRKPKINSIHISAITKSSQLFTEKEKSLIEIPLHGEDNQPKSPTKKSPRAYTIESGIGVNSILANAIARKEKIYEQILPDKQRLSRRIKPTAKILANEELRHGFQLQNNARLTLSNENLLEQNDSKSEVEVKTSTSAPSSVPPSPPATETLTNGNPSLSITPPPVTVQQSTTPTINRKPCPDPEQFLNEIKTQKIGLNRSPEDKNKKLNKKQQRRLFKLKEKHFAKLGLQKITKIEIESDTDDLSDDHEEFIPKRKIQVTPKSGVTLRIRNSSKTENSDYDTNIVENDKPILNRKPSHPPLLQQIKESILNESSPPPVLSNILNNNSNSINNNIKNSNINTKEESLIYNCLCEKKSQYYVRKSQELMQCVAVDQIEKHQIGCSNEVSGELLNLMRPSSRVSYMILCESHRKRLMSHNCCAGCGIFCSQGLFAICEKNHLFHRDCATKFILNTPFNTNYIGDKYTGPTLSLKCPHCGLEALKEDFKITLKCRNSSVFLPHNLKRAKMVFPSDNVQMKLLTNTSSSNKQSQITTLVDIEKLIPDYIYDLIATAKRDVNPFISYTKRDLFLAIHNDDVKRVAEMIACDMDITTSFAEFQNGTCLHLVSSTGTVTMSYLIFSKVKSQYFLDQMDNELRTAVMCSVAAEKHEVLKILILFGADVSVKGTDGMTALHLAARKGDLKSTKIILEYYRQCKNTMKFKAFIDSVDDGNWTALVWAAEHGHSDIVCYLISLGADPNICDKENNTALHWAALSNCVETVIPLLQSNCNFNVQNIQGDTPLHISCRHQNAQISLIFLAHGADLNIKNSLNETPYESIINENSQCAKAIRFNINLRNVIEYPKRTIISQDVSNGRERYPIQIIINQNHNDDDYDVPDFKYITKTILLQNSLQIDQRISQMRICTCSDDCSTDDCQCSLISLQNWYNAEGRLKDDFCYEDPAMIFECNDVCGCNRLVCKNRVVQNGIKCRLQIIDCTDKSKGWGVQTLSKIVKGSFIAEYTGEILTDTEADRRTDDSYFFDLGSVDHCIDANFYGNISRFFNHSCSPNIVPVRVYYEHQDLRFPKIAFFASRNIEPGEEITFDYGEKFWIVKFKNFTCQCKTSICKYSKTTISKTLEEYNQRNSSSLC